MKAADSRGSPGAQAGPAGGAGGESARRPAPSRRRPGRRTWGAGAGSSSPLVLVLVALFAVLAATKLLVLAALFAVLLGGTFLPVVDWLQRHHIRRSLGALIVVALTIVLAILIGLVIIHGLVEQVPTIQAERRRRHELPAEVARLDDHAVEGSDRLSSRPGCRTRSRACRAGAAGTVASVIGDIGSLLFGIFISINIGVWVLIRGREIGRWASKHLPPIPQPTAYAIIANSARFFRGYIFGQHHRRPVQRARCSASARSIVGVPMAGTIAIVAWLMNYIPYFGAIISGAFTVLIAYGAGGTVDGHPDAHPRDHRQRLPADDGLAVRPGLGAQPAPAGGAVRHHRRRHPLRRRGRRLRGAVREDRPRRLRPVQADRAVRPPAGFAGGRGRHRLERATGPGAAERRRAQARLDLPAQT